MTRIKKKVLPIMAISLVLVIFGREIWQIVSVKYTVDKVASYVARYLSTGEYDPDTFKTSAVQHRALLYLYNDQNNAPDVSPEYLSSLIANGKLKDDIRIETAVIDAARYFSALNEVNEFEANLPNPEKLKIVVCSDRDGYLYKAAKDKVEPHSAVYNSEIEVNDKMVGFDSLRRRK